MKVCETCGQPIRARRSVEISTHFHAHVTQVAHELKWMGVPAGRDEVYLRVLLLACEMEPVEGAEMYPYVIVNDMLHPKRTTNRSNKEMMQAVEAAHRFAVVGVREVYGADPIQLREVENGRTTDGN